MGLQVMEIMEPHGDPRSSRASWGPYEPRWAPIHRGARRSIEEPGGSRKSQEEHGGTRGARGSQEDPGRARRSYEEPGARGSQEEPGRGRTSQVAKEDDLEGTRCRSTEDGCRDLCLFFRQASWLIHACHGCAYLARRCTTVNAVRRPRKTIDDHIEELGEATGARRSQGETGGAKRSQEEPRARRSQEEHGGARSSQEEDGGGRRRRRRRLLVGSQGPIHRF